MEKPFRQVTKINITSNKSCCYHVPTDRMHWEGHFTSGMFFPKIHNPNLIMKKQQTHPNWGTFYKMYILKELRSCKIKTENYDRLKESKQTWQVNVTWYPGIEKRYSGNSEIQIKSMD